MDNNPTQLFDIADKYLEARDKHDESARATKSLKDELEELEWQLIQTMEESDLKSFKRNGVNLTVAVTPCMSPEPDRKNELWDRMKEQGYESLFTIHSATLQSEIKRMADENDGQLPEWLDGLIKQFDRKSIQKRKA